MEKMNTVKPLFPHLPECLADLVKLESRNASPLKSHCYQQK